MEKIKFDAGFVTYRLGDLGQLRFNPSDPNLYSRFLEALEKLRALEADLPQRLQKVDRADGGAVVAILAQVDADMKKLLNWVFGPGNDFGEILRGVNLLAVAGNGERVVTNLFTALEPVLVSGAKRCAQEQAAAAKARKAGK